MDCLGWLGHRRFAGEPSQRLPERLDLRHLYWAHRMGGEFNRFVDGRGGSRDSRFACREHQTGVFGCGFTALSVGTEVRRRFSSILVPAMFDRKGFFLWRRLVSLCAKSRSFRVKRRFRRSCRWSSLGLRRGCSSLRERPAVFRRHGDCRLAGVDYRGWIGASGASLCRVSASVAGEGAVEHRVRAGGLSWRALGCAAAFVRNSCFQGSC